MIRHSLLKFCSLLYSRLAKPILFSIQPDKVHDSMIKFSSIISKTKILRSLIGLIFKSGIDARLSQAYHGIEFTNPVGLSAGFDKNGEIMPAIAALGFGFGTVGSVTATKCVGNPKPWFYRLPKTKATVVNAGLGNDGSLVIINRIKKYSKKSIKNFPIVLSVAKTNSRKVVSVDEGIDDYISTLKRAKNIENIKMFELNISCPNVYGGEPFTAPKRLEKLLKSVDTLGLSKPVFIKMPVDLLWADFRDLLEVITKYRIAGVTISNLAKDRSAIDFKDELPDEVPGNISGKPTWDKSNYLIRKTYLNYGDKLTIIGVGGIFDAKDAYEKIKCGASLVEIITGMLFNGPQLAAQINNDLVKLISKDGYDTISQAIGVNAK